MDAPRPFEASAPAAATRGLGLVGRLYTYEGCSVLALSGEIDVSCLPAFRRLLQDAVDRGDGRVVLDLGDVTLMDLAAVGELVQALQRTGWESGSISLLHPTPFVRRVLDLTRVGSVFPIHDTLDTALAGWTDQG